MAGTVEDFEKLCGVKIRVLPDFLMDHTLLEEQFAQRLPEHTQRWIDFVQRLGVWKGKATFCLRFDGHPENDAVGIYLLASLLPDWQHERDRLQRDIEFALSAYGIVTDVFNPRYCLPLLTRKQIEECDLISETRAQLESEIFTEFSSALSKQNHVHIGIYPGVTKKLCYDRDSLKEILLDERFRELTDDAPDSPIVPLLWDGPLGSYLLPFKALLGSGCPLQVSIYLQPCELEDIELLWLQKIAESVQREPGHDSQQSTSAGGGFVSSICDNAVRRLFNNAFRVAITITAPTVDSGAAAHNLANTMQALCAQKQTENEPLDELRPVGTIVEAASAEQQKLANDSHSQIEFPYWTQCNEIPKALTGLQYLTDSRGAATAFRLPVSTRGGVPGVEVEQPPPDFNPGPRSHHKQQIRKTRLFKNESAKASVLIGRFESAGYASVPIDDFTKHTLVTGFTGSGKTQTVMNILHQLWVDHKVPFLVIESAKVEYRGLMEIPEFQEKINERGILIYTLGNESVAPLRLNPFELIEGVRVESHIGRLQTCFEAALPPIGPLSSILEQSLIDVYRDLGWMMTDVGLPSDQIGPNSEHPSRRYPTMSDFGAKLLSVAESRGYEGEFKSTLQAAIRGRILPLTKAFRGSKGALLDVPSTNPTPSVLFSSPIILELNDLNDQDKALVSMFLLTLLREFREREFRKDSKTVQGLKHVTVIEEAHHVLENQSPVSTQDSGVADTRCKAVQAFCSMLAEIRALNEGLIICDQSPEKLAPDAIRNTNIQIAHQLRDSRDRNVIANTMTMSQEQREYLGKLRPGHAAVFYTGLQKASFIKVPRFDKADEEFDGRGVNYAPALSDSIVKAHMFRMSGNDIQHDRPFHGCASCGHVKTCDFKWQSRDAVAELPASKKQEFISAFLKTTNSEKRASVVRSLLASENSEDLENDAAWCLFLHLRHDLLNKESESGIPDSELREYFLYLLANKTDEVANERDLGRAAQRGGKT